MVVYSINDLEKLSGVKAHTIRIWEKRYDIIKPKRTGQNIRYYLDDDLKRILNIALLNRNGIKISKIAKMTSKELRQKVVELADLDENMEDKLDALTLCVLQMEEQKFNKILDNNIDQKGFYDTINDVIHPLLDKLSTMWIAGSIKGVHEHFVSNLIRMKTIEAINNTSKEINPVAEKCLLFLPEKENQELSLLFLQYLLLTHNKRVINLGANINIGDAIDAYEIYKPEYVFSIVNDNKSDMPLQQIINILSKRMPSSSIYLSGLQTVIQPIELAQNTYVFKSLGDINSIFTKNKPKAISISN